MHLTHDLHDVYGQKIAAQGCEISARVLRDIIKQGALLPRKTIPVVKTPLFKDFKKALRDHRYHHVFTQPETKKKLLRTFSRLKFTDPILLELLHMKRRLPDTYHHVLMMSALVIKTILDIKNTRLDPLLAAYLCLTHDLGKTRIPKTILNKKEELTLAEYRTIQTHPLIGYVLLNYYWGWQGKKYCRTALDHHEKLDGSGYPRGIKKIDSYSKLIAPVDIYDALISKRPYRKLSYNGRLAMDILLEDAQRGKLHKPSVYQLVNCIREQKVGSVAEMRVSQKRRTLPPIGNHYGKIKKTKARRLLRSD